MSNHLSPRARAILEAAERLAAQRGAVPVTPAPPPIPTLPLATAAQLGELAEHVRLTVETVRARLEELAANVDALAAQLDELHRERAAVAAPPPPAPPAPAPVATPATFDDAPRLLAIELAVAGATRAEVDARLRERFGVRSTAELLDEVFGVGSAPGARLPWDDGGR